jgi:hypothetical protein
MLPPDLLGDYPSRNPRPVLLQSARAHEKPDVAARNRLLHDGILRCPKIFGGIENLLRRRDVIGRREYDPVTYWVTKHIVKPHRNNPDLWFAVRVGRLVNEPSAVAELLPYLLPFDAARCRETLEARQARGAKCFRNVRLERRRWQQSGATVGKA